MTSGGAGGSPIAVRDEMNFFAKDFTPVIVLRRVSASYEGLNELVRSRVFMHAIKAKLSGCHIVFSTEKKYIAS